MGADICIANGNFRETNLARFFWAKVRRMRFILKIVRNHWIYLKRSVVLLSLPFKRSVSSLEAVAFYKAG